MLETICGGVCQAEQTFLTMRVCSVDIVYLSLRQVNHISSHVNTIDTLDTPAFLMLG